MKKVSPDQINFYPAEACRREGLKSEARMGDHKQILSIYADFTQDYPQFINALIKLGIQRAKRRSSKRAK